ncbi:MAG: EAL domain-containing protein, partial [Microthrixaceae bacterium]
LMSPGYFLDKLDELGLIGQLDSWMRREGFAAMARINSRFGEEAPYLSLNVTERELQSATFKEEVLEQIRRAGFPAEQVVLELSENAFVDLEGHEDLLVELRATGVRIALDDFGTGYSSLMQLQQLPIDIVKLDRAFVSALTSGGTRALGVLEGLLQVISAVELTLVVEGVETEAEQQTLVSLGCEYAQGYLYGRPAPAAEVLTQVLAELPTQEGEFTASS